MNVVNNFGSVQSSVGQSLSGSAEEFWVAAAKDGGSEMYRYEGEPPYIFHYPPGPTNRQGDCLTFSSDDGALVTRVRLRGTFSN